MSEKEEEKKREGEDEHDEERVVEARGVELEGRSWHRFHLKFRPR